MTRSGKAKTFATRRNGGRGGKPIYRRFARMSADQGIRTQIAVSGFPITRSRAITGSTDLHGFFVQSGSSPHRCVLVLAPLPAALDCINPQNMVKS